MAIPVVDFEFVRTQRDGSKKIEMTLSAEQFEKYERVKELLAHQNFNAKRTQDMSDVLETAFDYILKQMTQPFTAAKNETWNSLTPQRKKQIKQRDQCCQYIDKKTGRQCKTRFHLETDHIHPRWDNGNNDPGNLQVLCAAHNRHRYHKQSRLH